MSNNDNIILRIEFTEDDSINQILINKKSTIQNLKLAIKNKLNINCDEQVLINKGEILQNDKLIKDYNITNNNRIILIIEEKENEIIKKKETKRGNENIIEKEKQNLFFSKGTTNKKYDTDSVNNNMLEIPNEMIKNEKKVTNNYILDSNSKLNEDFKSSENTKETNNSNIIQKIKKGIISIFDNINIFKDKNNDEKKDNINNHFRYNNNNTFNNNNNRRIFNHQKIMIPDGTYNIQLSQLNDLGFSNYEVNLQLLYEYNGNIEKCVDKLLTINQNK